MTRREQILNMTIREYYDLYCKEHYENEEAKEKTQKDNFLICQHLHFLFVQCLIAIIAPNTQMMILPNVNVTTLTNGLTRRIDNASNT